MPLFLQEQPPQGEAGEAGSSQQQGQPDPNKQRELQLDMQTAEGRLEECALGLAKLACIRMSCAPEICWRHTHVVQHVACTAYLCSPTCTHVSDPH